ncbi:MAG: hypothetical protein A3F84_13955 [Candidatus Handelsmanbacteria bacterium RIFCSPLOWO2_12_FULL_64_10]|uniref:EF-hand domain-containing protein n=1 Tax=Handelsmanbacteria sp. (strain RIFCSPLOWO2_12_FULL_64_10) TaxID=1817868 RepID=A0A1F6CCV3_HANXR|nr:MAG: hypothetical protein A3F84_13955 [Candidatus Handelsmanbacteria bacterium RIFCSPLOWO2_12_FULL_64_10]
MNFRILLFLCVLCVLCGKWGSACAQPFPGTRSEALASGRLIADYDGELRRSDGRLDAPLLIQQLKGLKANVYFYLIWHRDTDWEDLKLFLPEARAAGIEVWVYLVPPSESPPRTTLYSEPFRLDYILWGEEIGKLSVAHPNLTAFVIDDFWANSTFFTPGYVGRMRAAGRQHNPGLLFLPLMYYREMSRRFVLDYRDVIDGAVVAYPKGPEDIRLARSLLLDRDESPARWVFTYPYQTRSEPGDFAEARCLYAVAPADRYLLRLTGGDDYLGPTSGYHVKQVLVDGEVVWQEDVAGGAVGMRAIQADVTAQVKGKSSVTVAVRVIDLRAVSNFGVEVSWSEVEADGLKPADGSSWTASAGGRWQTAFEAARHGEGAFRIPFVVMVAASREAFPRRVGLEATPENIRDHVEMAFSEMRRGNADGVVTYVLDKRPGNPDYAAVQTAFLRAARFSPPSPDFDGDGTVGFDDFFLFADAFGSKEARFDLDGDEAVGFDDFFVFAASFGKRR